MKHVGIHITERDAALITVERDDGGHLTVRGIERLPSDLATVAARVRTIEPTTVVLIDAEGLGSALWTVLGPDHPSPWRLYAGRGLERQALVDELLVAVAEDRFRFAAGLAEQEAMTKALTSYRRQVGVDGLIGSELVVALLLAVRSPKPEPIYFIPFEDVPDADDDANEW